MFLSSFLYRSVCLCCSHLCSGSSLCMNLSHLGCSLFCFIPQQRRLLCGPKPGSDLWPSVFVPSPMTANKSWTAINVSPLACDPWRCALPTSAVRRARRYQACCIWSHKRCLSKPRVCCHVPDSCHTCDIYWRFSRERPAGGPWLAAKAASAVLTPGCNGLIGFWREWTAEFMFWRHGL